LTEKKKNEIETIVKNAYTQFEKKVDDTDGREPKMLLLVPIQIKISEIS
jgi:hypothetical protein